MTDYARSHWNENEADYPHQAIAPIGDPKPQEYKRTALCAGEFIACPFDGVCHWGFEEVSDRDNFLILYPEATKVKENA